jgi:hypothetical protein
MAVIKPNPDKQTAAARARLAHEQNKINPLRSFPQKLGNSCCAGAQRRECAESNIYVSLIT